MNDNEKDRVAEIGMVQSAGHVADGIGKAMKVCVETGAVERFNRELLKSGLIPDALPDITLITYNLGIWIGQNLRDGVPLNEAIAEIEIVAATPLATLLAEQDTRSDRIRVTVLKSVLSALELCCLPGMVVEAATCIIRTTMFAVDQAVSEHLPSA